MKEGVELVSYPVDERSQFGIEECFNLDQRRESGNMAENRPSTISACQYSRENQSLANALSGQCDCPTLVVLAYSEEQPRHAIACHARVARKS
jgi:hypothetical protein